MSNRKVYISVISVYNMTNKESKQTKKTETKGLYNSITSVHSLNKTGDKQKMQERNLTSQDIEEGYTKVWGEENKRSSAMQVESSVNQNKLKDSDRNKEEISTTKENAREQDKGESDTNKVICPNCEGENAKTGYVENWGGVCPDCNRKRIEVRK